MHCGYSLRSKRILRGFRNNSIQKEFYAFKKKLLAKKLGTRRGSLWGLPGDKPDARTGTLRRPAGDSEANAGKQRLSFFQKLSKNKPKRQRKTEPKELVPNTQNRIAATVQTTGHNRAVGQLPSPGDSDCPEDEREVRSVLKQMVSIHQQLRFDAKSRFKFKKPSDLLWHAKNTRATAPDFDYKKLNGQNRGPANFLVMPETRPQQCSELGSGFLTLDDIRSGTKKRFNFYRLIKRRQSMRAKRPFGEKTVSFLQRRGRPKALEFFRSKNYINLNKLSVRQMSASARQKRRLAGPEQPKMFRSSDNNARVARREKLSKDLLSAKHSLEANSINRAFVYS